VVGKVESSCGALLGRGSGVGGAHGEQLGVHAGGLRDEDLQAEPVVTEHEHELVPGGVLMDQLERRREACATERRTGPAVLQRVEPELPGKGLRSIARLDSTTTKRTSCSRA
jgi:hypothetical protein